MLEITFHEIVSGSGLFETLRTIAVFVFLQIDVLKGETQNVRKLDEILIAHEQGTVLMNKAGYTATLVACGWAGAVFELLKHLGKCSEAKDRKNIKLKKVKWGPTDRPTDGRTKRGVESRSTQLKQNKKESKETSGEASLV